MSSFTTCMSTRRFNLPIRTGVGVETVERADGQWRVRTQGGAELTAPVVVMATGIVSNPYTASIAGRERFAGRVLHSVEYRRPDAHVGRRVLVIGAGNSAGEIAAELAAAGAHVAVAVRSGRVWCRGTCSVCRFVPGRRHQPLSPACAAVDHRRDGARRGTRARSGGPPSAAADAMLRRAADWVPSRRCDSRRDDPLQARRRRVHPGRCAIRRRIGRTLR